jgi:uncharacterized membrane protein YeiB
MLKEDLDECLWELPPIISHQMEDFFRGGPLEMSYRRLADKKTSHVVELVVFPRARTSTN